MQPSIRYDNNNDDDEHSSMTTATVHRNYTSSSTKNNSRPSRRRRRRSHSTGREFDPNHDDPHTWSIPLQAMKRLRVDATQTTTESFGNDIASSYNTSHASDGRMLRTTPEIPTTPIQQQQQQQSEDQNQYKYDPYHCYQRHQYQETGQDTDGWSSPEPSPSVPVIHDRRHTHIDTASSSSLPLLYDQQASFHKPNSDATPSVLLADDSHDDNTNNIDDAADEMDYQNVNHILGNLHFERQQRISQQQQLYVPTRSEYNHHHNTYINHHNHEAQQPIAHESQVSELTCHRNGVLSSSSSSFHTVPPTTPLNTRMLRHQQFLDGGLLQQHHPPLSSIVSSSSMYNNKNHHNDQYQTPPPKPTKRKVVQLYTNSKLG